MAKNEKEFALRVVKSRIRHVVSFIESQNKLIQRMEREIETKQGSSFPTGGGFGVSTEYDECLSKKILRESEEKKKRALENLSGYNYILNMLNDK